MAKRPKSKNSQSGWMQCGALLLIGYIIFSDFKTDIDIGQQKEPLLNKENTHDKADFTTQKEVSKNIISSPVINTPFNFTTPIKGTGSPAKCGEKVEVSFTGFLKSGKIFEENKIMSFTIGEGEVIAGLEQGVDGMRINSKRQLYIPSGMGYNGVEFLHEKAPVNQCIGAEVTLLRITPNEALTNAKNCIWKSSWK